MSSAGPKSSTSGRKSTTGRKSSTGRRGSSGRRSSASSSVSRRSSEGDHDDSTKKAVRRRSGAKYSADKSKGNRKRDGTPEKPVTPNQSQSQMEEEVIPPSKLKIDGEDVQALAINVEELAKFRAPKPPAGDRRVPSAKKRVVVRKMKPQSELDKPKMKKILIAKPAPPDATLKKDDFSGCVGPRYDTVGNIVPHSILGSVEDFKLEAIHQGQMDASQLKEVDTRPKTPSIKFEKKTKDVFPTPRESNMDESNALRNWQMKMLERKKQQGYISKLLLKPVESLVMNQSEDFRKTQEDRYLINRAIPAMDYGKGYRVGSEFWKQQERVGDDLSGVHMTLTQTERGYPPPVEHISHPQTVKKEMGTEWKPPSTPTNYPWHLSQYLKERREQLNHVLDDLDPYAPASGELEVIGKSVTGLKEDAEKAKEAKQAKAEKKPLSAVEEEKSNNGEDKQGADAPITGPSLQFNGYAAAWTGDSHSHKNQIAHGARVTFEAFAGERFTSFLQLVNNGTTTIYYDWKKIPKVNPFEGCATPKVQRFYFNTSSGVLLPGESLKFPFVFKSPNAGIFSETWQLDTRPTLCGGAALRVTLRGVALQEDKTKMQRNEIEQELFHKQAEMAVRRIIDDLVDGVKTPERARSPIDAYITDEERFERNNPQMHYSNEVVTRLQHLYVEQFPEEERDGKSWDLSVETMKREFLSLDDEELQEDLLARMNASVTSLYFPPFTPIQHEMYKVGYQMMAETVDNIVSQAAVLRNHLGMPEKDVAMPETEAILAANEQLRGGIVIKKRAASGRFSAESEGERKKRRDKEKEDEDEPKGKGKKGKEKDGGKKGKKDDKDKDRPKSKQGGGKSKSRAASSPTPSTREKRSKTPVGDRRTPTPMQKKEKVSETGDPELDAKYNNKMYIQTYSLLYEMVDKMTQLFEDIRQLEGEKLLATLL